MKGRPSSSSSARVVGPILVAAVLAVSSLTACAAGLSGSSSCSEYMNASRQEQQHIVSQLAGKYHKGVWATPLGFPGVAYYCADHPDVTLDQFFSKASSY